MATCLHIQKWLILSGFGLLTLNTLLAGFTLDKASYSPDEPIAASWTDSPGNGLDWIGIYSNPGNGPVDNEFVEASTIWLYTNGTQTGGDQDFVDGSVTFGVPGLPEGDYIAFFLESDGYFSIDDPIEFTVLESDAVVPELFADPMMLVRAEVNTEYSGRLAAYTRGSDLTFSKVGADPAWLTVEENGDITGTPLAADLGAQNFNIRVENSDGIAVEGSVNLEVVPPGGAPVTALNVMAYNLWVGGTPSKNLEGIIKSGSDVIGLQETNGARAREHAQALGWHFAQGGGSVGILSKYPIVETMNGGSGMGARVQISADPLQEIVFWSCHLSAFPYGPYDACWDGESVDVLLDRETSSGRLPQVQRILDEMEDAIDVADSTPVFLVGDFNTPSHLDWTEATESTHCDYVVEWPVTTAVSAAGLSDAYRVANPDPVAKPGNTWSPIYSLRDSIGPEEEPQDRIDMIHFGGAGVSVQGAEVFILPGILEDVPNHGANAWASDHAAVVSQLTIPAPTGERVGRAFSPVPTPRKTGVIGAELMLTWRGDTDVLTYDVYFGGTPALGAEQLQSNVAQPPISSGELEGGTTYYWKVDTLKEGNVRIEGEVWSFTTAAALGDSGRWEFNEGTGTNVADSGGGEINGTLFEIDEDDWVDTSILDKGIALNFDNGWVEFGEEPVLRPTEALTIAAWVKPEFFGDYAGIAGYVYDTGAVESGYTLHTRAGDLFGWGVGTDDLGSILYLSSSEPYDADEWHFVVGTYDGSNLKLYVNGAEVASAGMTGPIDYDPLPESGFIAGSYLDDNDDIRFEGELTQLEFWPRALSGSEIQSMFSATGAIICPSGFTCTVNPAAGEVALSWVAPANVDATGLELLRDGELIASLALDAVSYTDSPPNAGAAGLVEVIYTLRLVGNNAENCESATCTAGFFNGSLEDELAFYLSFDAAILDESGNEVMTDITGEPTATSDGAIGGAYTFDDTADPRQYLVLEDSKILQFGESTDFSVSIWVRTTSPLTDNRDNGGTNFDPAIISNKDWNSGLNPGWVIAANSSNGSNGEGNLEWNIGDGSVRADFDPTGAVINDGDWHHIAVSHDRDDVARFYLDGVELGSVDISAIGDIDSGLTTNVATDGTEGTGWENWFPGDLDDLAIWRRVISPEEVALIHSSGVSGTSAVGGSGEAFAIDTMTYSQSPGGLTLSWPSRSSRSYAIESSTDLKIWVELDDGLSPGEGGRTTFTVPVDPAATKEQYVRVISNPG
ncbi:MAG: hypothetical protein ACI9R3_000291 [Verrucomicrobiales bacterium]|jgi:hypothetical protein